MDSKKSTASPAVSPSKASAHGPSSSISTLNARPGLNRASGSFSSATGKRHRARSETPTEAFETPSDASSLTSSRQSRSPSSSSSRNESHTPRSPYESSSSGSIHDGVRRRGVEWLAALADADARREAGESNGPLVPPLGFAMVAPGVYRSGHPNHRNFRFLEGLHLKSIMYLCSDKPKPHTDHWAQERGIKVFHYRIDPTKDPSAPPTDPALYAAALSDLLDRRNLPILVHCNKGKHRVGTFCALLRRVQGYSLESVGAEWIKFIEEGAPPGSTGLWSPPVHGKGSLASKVEGFEKTGGKAGRGQVEGEVKRGKDGRIKDKAHESRSRAREWSYIEDFPIQIVNVRAPEWRPFWLPTESVEGLDSR